MNLSDVFTAVAHKNLVIVDLPHAGSHQHEFNGSAALKVFFGTEEPQRGSIDWHFFADDQEPKHAEGSFHFYDARARSAARTGRSEWRLYYTGDFLSNAAQGDLLILAKTHSGAFIGLIFEKGSSWQRATVQLLGIAESGSIFGTVPRSTLDNRQLDFLERRILAELDIELTLPTAPNDEQIILERFGQAFPSTREMSIFARENVDVDINQPDEALTRWLNREEQLFRALENVIISSRLAQNFATVDEFIGYSLSVQNRRKSRMGHALQNQLAELFSQSGLRFCAQARTEANNKPDFIFPGQGEYNDPAFDQNRLLMLGVKSSSKDRWRQILTEADRIPHKHLCTLEAGISTKQTDEMRRQNLSLVIPEELHITYTAAQRAQIINIEQFIAIARGNQIN